MDANSLTQRAALNVWEEITQAQETPASTALATGIPRSTLNRRLTGKSTFTVSEIELLAAHFGTTPVELLRAEVEAA